MKTFALPDLGEGLQEAEIVAWHVAVGDRVVADQPLVAVETEKAVVEIPSPWSGTVAALHGRAGDILQTGAPLVDFEDGAPRDKGAVVGNLEQAARTPAKGAERKTPTPKPTPAARAPGVKAVPAVRALAAQLGIALAGIKGSGPGGAITRADVQAAAKEAIPEGYEPLRGPRRAMARNMARSGAETVPATLTDDADVDAWWTPDADVAVRLLRALAQACSAEAALNAWYDGAHEARKLHERVDVGVAIDTAEGLFVPVLHDIAAKRPEELRHHLDVMRKKVVTRSLMPADLRGATITLSNFGMLAGRHAALAIVPPQVAIVGAGRIGPEVVVVDGKPAMRTRLPLSLTFDHRAVTGGEAARFMGVLIDNLQKAE